MVAPAATSPPAACCAPLATPSMSDSQAATTARVFKALADPHRVQILNLLANSRGPVCVCEITEHVELAQPTTSFHLKKLVAAGLLERRRQGTWAYYSIRHEVLRDLKKVFETKETRR